MLGSFFETVIAAIYRFINRWRVWYRLPFPLAVINLLALRVDLRWRNLFDTETAPLDPPVPGTFDIRHCRTTDGAFNDLSKTWMGMADTRFGRNAPLPQTFGEQSPSLYEPNPRIISRAFRRMLRMSVPKSFQELTESETWQKELEKKPGCRTRRPSDRHAGGN